MGETLLCRLGFFLFWSLCCGYLEVPITPTVIQQPNWAQIYRGEKVTLRCEIQDDGGSQWTYEWEPTNGNSPTSSEIMITVDSSGDYSCRGRRRNSFTVTKWGVVTLTVISDKPSAKLTADRTIIPAGGSITLTCSVDESDDWKFDWFRNDQQYSVDQFRSYDKLYRVISVSEGGVYSCRGGRGNPVFYTEKSNVQKIVSGPTVNQHPSWPVVFRGETVTLRCEMQDDEGTQWTYEWSPANRYFPTSNEYKINSISEYDRGSYYCKASKGDQRTDWSSAFTLTVNSNEPKASLTASDDIIPAGGSVTLTCSVDIGVGWKFYWFRQESEFSTAPPIRLSRSGGVFIITEGGVYICRGGRGNPVFYTGTSNNVTIQKTVHITPTLIQQPNWAQIYRGERVTLRCEIQDDGGSQWTYEWKPTNRNSPTSSEIMITVDSSGDYRCRGRRNSFTFTEWGVVTLTVFSPKPHPVLSVSPSWPNPGASVTLNCEGLELQSAGWRFFWYKTVPDWSSSTYTYELLPGSINGTEQNSFIINGPTLTAGFVCRAERGEPKFYSDYSEVKFVWSADSAAASLSVNPDRVQHFWSESVTLTCKGNSTEWRVMRFIERDRLSSCSMWGKMTGSTCTININWSVSGVFWCESGSGEFSNAVNITVQVFPPQPVLSVSPSWPNPGASVTLSCEGLELQSAGWRFFWYKTVPATTSSTYRYELLPGSTRGTEQNYFIINGPTLTAGFVCRAGRGEPKFYSNYSEVKFVWSADSHPAASLSVSPDRVQHFIDQSVTMKCGENDTKWRLRRFTESTSPSYVRCSNWGTMHGSSCTINRLEDHSGVYWCESESGEFSNSVNITVQDDYDGIILVSPVHPVTEGDPVTLSCRDKKQNLLSNVFFYHNDKLIQNDSREELKISAVSKSDEGFYKCQHSGKESPSSWMSVRVTLSSPVSSSRLLLIIGPISGIILIIFLLLLWRYRQPKDLCSFRSDKNNQRSTTNHRAEIEISDNNAPSEGDALYASVKPSEATEPAEPKEITYTMIKFKKLRKKRKPRKPEECVVYAEVKPRAAELAPTYAVVNKSKAKKNRKEKPAATNEPVYSEIKSGATLNDESAL